MDNLKEKLKQLLAEAEAQETINDFVEEETFSEESVNESFDDLLKVLTGLREEKIEAEYKEENEVENDETDATTEENPKDENKGDGKTKDGEDHIDNEVETEEAQAGENKGANDALKEETVNAEYKEEHSEENTEKAATTEEAQSGETKTEPTPLKAGEDHINNEVETEKAQGGESKTEATPLKAGEDHIDNDVETEEAQAGENKTEQKPLKEETVNAEYKEEHSEENTEEEAKTEEAQAGETKTEATPLKAGADHIDNKVETEEAQAGETKTEATPLKAGADHIDNKVETEEAQAGENKTEQKPLKEDEEVEDDIEELLFESIINDIFVQKRGTDTIIAEFIKLDPELNDQYLDMLNEEELNQLLMEIDILTLSEEELEDKLNYDILTLLYESEDFDFIDGLSDDTINVLYEMLTDDIILDETELLDESIRTFANNMKDRFKIAKAKVMSRYDQNKTAKIFKKRSKLETTKDKFKAKDDIKKIKRAHKDKKKNLKKSGEWNDFTASELSTTRRNDIKDVKDNLRKYRKNQMDKADEDGREKQKELTKANIEGLKKNIETRTAASNTSKLNLKITKAGSKYDLFMKKYKQLLANEDITKKEDKDITKKEDKDITKKEDKDITKKEDNLNEYTIDDILMIDELISEAIDRMTDEELLEAYNSLFGEEEGMLTEETLLENKEPIRTRVKRAGRRIGMGALIATTTIGGMLARDKSKEHKIEANKKDEIVSTLSGEKQTLEKEKEDATKAKDEAGKKSDGAEYSKQDEIINRVNKDLEDKGIKIDLAKTKRDQHLKRSKLGKAGFIASAGVTAAAPGAALYGSEYDKRRKDAKAVKKESVEYTSLSEAILLGGEYFTSESLLTESSEDKITRLQEQVALLIAKESNDPLFEEFVENTISSNNLRNHIIQKYSEISREKTGEIIGEEVLSAEAKKDVEKVTKDVPNPEDDPKYKEVMTQARKDYMEDKKNKK